MRIGNENLFFNRQEDEILTCGGTLNGNRLDFSIEIAVFPELETVFLRYRDDVILNRPAGLFQGERPIFPLFSKFWRGLPWPVSGLAPIEESMIAPVKTFNNILRGLRTELIPMMIFWTPLQLCQMLLHLICRDVLSMDFKVPLLQCQKMIPYLTGYLNHFVKMLCAISDIQFIGVGFTDLDEHEIHL